MLIKDIQKYNPSNIVPEKLFAAPTIKIQEELLYLIGQLSIAFNAVKVEPNIGTELEVLFFSPDIDPYSAPVSGKKSRKNPNFSNPRRAKVTNLYELIEQMYIIRPNEYLMPQRIGELSIELRTTPQSVAQHLESIQRLGDVLRKESRKLNMYPVIYSQHIHISLRSLQKYSFLRRKPFTEKELELRQNRMINFYSRLNPMVLLPEEWGYYNTRPLRWGNDHIKSKNDLMYKHPEIRKLSSEYAADPVLNLLVSLLVMYEGFLKTYPLTGIIEPSSYSEGVKQMESDKYLQNFFGSSTLQTLVRILHQYPDVSQRKITLDQVK